MNIHIAIMTIRVEIYTVIYKTAFFFSLQHSLGIFFTV